MSFAVDPAAAPHAPASWPTAVEGELVEATADAWRAAGEPDPLRQPGAGQLGVVTSSPAEAECLRQVCAGGAPCICVSGGSVLRARAGAERLRQEGVLGLVSFGVALGLAPVLAPATW